MSKFIDSLIFRFNPPPPIVELCVKITRNFLANFNDVLKIGTSKLNVIGNSTRVADSSML